MTNEMHWRSIETAPKDGNQRFILYSLDIGVCTGSWCEGYHGLEDCWETDDGECRYTDCEVTHWMPFPAPPEEMAA